DVWEAGLPARDAQRTFLLHALARPADDADRLSGVPVGERDADLLALRQRLFGDEVPLRVACGSCGEELEVTPAVPARVASAPSTQGGVHAVEVGEWTVRFRLPPAADLAYAAEAGPARARRVLFTRCVVEATRAGRPVAADQLPPEVQERVAQASSDADPRADIRLNLPCPECAAQTRAVLDIGATLWAELDAWARGTLLDVYLLASSFGWSELDV